MPTTTAPARPTTTKTREILAYPSESVPLVEIAPGQKLVALPANIPGQVLVYDLIHVGDNLYRAVARVHDREIRLSAQNLKLLGLPVSYKTIRRLMVAGFIKSTEVAPECHAMNLSSYYEHRDRCAADPEFWRDAARLRRYRDARNIV